MSAEDTVAMLARCREHCEPPNLYGDLTADEYAQVTVTQTQPTYRPMATEYLAVEDQGVDGHGDFALAVEIP